MLRTIGFDGDDTLWHNESLFALSQERFYELVRPYMNGEATAERLFAAEGRSLRLFGYGVKSFMLSMIETAIEASEGRVTAAEIKTIPEIGKGLLDHPVELLNGVRETIAALDGTYELLLIIKGDLFHQESRIAGSGLGEFFDGIEIVSEKDPATYERILRRRGIPPEAFMQVRRPAGNRARRARSTSPTISPGSTRSSRPTRRSAPGTGNWRRSPSWCRS